LLPGELVNGTTAAGLPATLGLKGLGPLARAKGLAAALEAGLVCWRWERAAE